MARKDRFYSPIAEQIELVRVAHIRLWRRHAHRHTAHWIAPNHRTNRAVMPVDLSRVRLTELQLGPCIAYRAM